MGMFDYVKCEAPLPDGFMGDFQTKDFGCEMVTHVITADGKLMLERIDQVLEVPKAERPYPNDEGFLGLCGSTRTVTSLHETPFHGVMNFYGSEYRKPDGAPAQPQGTMQQGDNVCDWTTKEPLVKIWHEYNAKFTDGKLVEITQVADD